MSDDKTQAQGADASKVVEALTEAKALIYHLAPNPTSWGGDVDRKAAAAAKIDAALASMLPPAAPTMTRSQSLAAAGFTRRPSLWAMQARETLELIAAPQRPDGTWNRDREACRQLAAEALGRYDDPVIDDTPKSAAETAAAYPDTQHMPATKPCRQCEGPHSGRTMDLMQDECRCLSRWLASRLGARRALQAHRATSHSRGDEMSEEMKTAVLGPLPAHHFSNSRAKGGALYTADQMRAYAMQERFAERERCLSRWLASRPVRGAADTNKP